MVTALRGCLICLAASVGALLVTGCGGAGVAPQGAKAGPIPAERQGVVRGGQQPVAGATVQLYTVGTSGDGSAATPLLSPAVMTDANGGFNITGLYTCPSASALVYLVATGGNPGLGGSVNNSALALMAALGPCGSLTGSTYIVVNELTTVAAVYSLAPYMASATAVGSGAGDQTGLASAFALAAELVNTNTGTSPGTNIPAGTTVPVAQIDTIADILATCINSTGGTSGDGSACGMLFAMTTPAITPPTAPATNTVTALLSLANYPTLNTASLYALASATSPFQPVQAVTPPNFGVQLNSPSTLYVSPSSLNFGTWVAGYTTPYQTVGIQNYSSTTISLNATISGPGAGSFGFSGGTCGVTLAPQRYCSYQIDFSPTGAGALNAFFVLSSSLTNFPIEVGLTGVGVAPTAGPVVLSPSSLSFTVAGTSQDIQVENYGTTPLTISNVTFSNFGSNSGTYTNTGTFSQTNNCGTTLAAQSVCTISVVSTGIAWTTIGGPVTYTETMTILDNAVAGPQTVSLTSTNTAILRTSGGGTSGGSATTQVALTSGSFYSGANASYTVGGADAQDFSVSPFSCTFLGGFSSPCTVTVTFTPSVAGLRTAQLFVDGTEQYVPLGGGVAATSPGPAFVATPSPLSVGLSLPSAPDPYGLMGSGSLTITNTGTTTFSYSGILSGPNSPVFSVNGGNCTSLAPQQSCTLSVSLNGISTAGVYSAYLLIKDGNSTVSQLVPITGTASYWSVAAFPSSLQFGAQALGTTSTAKTFNLGDPNDYPIGHPLSVALVSPSNFVLTQGSACPASLTQTCTLAVAFSPYETGSILETATVTDQTTGYTSLLYLAGTGGASGVSLMPTSLTFPTRATGTTSIPMTVTLTNTGTLSLTVSSISVVGAANNNFTESNNCTTVAVNATCSINVTFAPTVAGSQSASIQIVSNAASSPDMVQLSGTAQ